MKVNGPVVHTKKCPRTARGARATIAGKKLTAFAGTFSREASRCFAHLVLSLEDRISAHRVLLAVLMP